jgi:hypothetical protein
MASKQNGSTTKDGLVFGFDTGDTYNSYLGRPTDNISYNIGLSNYNNVPGSVTTNLTQTSDTYKGAPIWVQTLTPLDGSGVSWLSNANNPGLGVVTGGGGGLANRYTGHSIFFKPTVPMSSVPIFLHYSNIGGWQSCCDQPEDMGDGWFRARVLWYDTTTRSDGKYWAINPLSASLNVPITIYWAGPFKEDLNSTAISQYVYGTRSVTQGLRDLTGNHSLDISNVTFNSDTNPKINFDGSDDYIVSTLTSSLSVYSLEILLYNNNAIPNDDTVIGGPSTFQTVISFNNTSNGVHLGAWTGSLTNEAIHIWNGGGATANQTYVGVGHHHLVFNWNGITYDIFVDGIKTPTQYLGGTTPATLINATSIKIGDDSDGYTFNGKIPSIKIYNRTLSEREILNNYQQYKGRFSLPAVKDGSSQALAAPSATYLKNLGISKDGNYWLQPSGQSAFQAPVKFYLNKAMVCVMKGGNGSGYVPDSSYWENTTLDNQNDFTLTNGVRSKYQSYNVVPFTEFYWTMGQLDYQTTFSLSSEVSSMYVAQTRSWNSSANRSSPHFGNSIDYRSLVGADGRYTSTLGTEIYLMGMDLKHEGHYGGGGGSSGGRIRVGSILDESTVNTASEAYGQAGSAFGIGVNGGNPLKTGVCGYAGWTEPSIIGGTDNWSLWVIF